LSFFPRDNGFWDGSEAPGSFQKVTFYILINQKTLPGNEATFPPTAFPSYSDFQPVPTASTPFPVPFFFGTAYGVSIQPQPTISINTPAASTPIQLTYSSTSAAASSTTSGAVIGFFTCELFGYVYNSPTILFFFRTAASLKALQEALSFFPKTKAPGMTLELRYSYQTIE